MDNATCHTAVFRTRQVCGKLEERAASRDEGEKDTRRETEMRERTEREKFGPTISMSQREENQNDLREIVLRTVLKSSSLGYLCNNQ